MPLRHTLADLLQQDPTLLDRLAKEGRYRKIDSVWAYGSVPAPIEEPGHPWRSQQEAEIRELRAQASGTRRAKVGP